MGHTTSAVSGAIVAQSGSSQAGSGTLSGFSAVFAGTLVVKQAGNFTFNVTSADGFIFGIGGGASRVSGINVNAPAATPFSQYPVLGANNTVSTGGANPIVVSFPAPGSYPYEVDYREGSGGSPSLNFGVRPVDSLVLTTTATAPRPFGQTATFTIVARDETGAPIPQLALNLTVLGVNAQTRLVTTDSTGTATLTYSGGPTTGTDLIQATATVNGVLAVSSQVGVTWISNLAPQITVTGDMTLQLPNAGHYSATVTSQGTGLTVAWSKVSGPGNVTFDTGAQASTGAIFDAPGTYMLQVAASDSQGSNTVPVGPITVQAAVNTAQGWIGSPLNQSHVSGVVPITVADGVTIQTGTLTYYPVANPSAVVTLKSNFSGIGQIAVLDTTLLANGVYFVQFQATDSTGKSMGSGIWLNVVGDYKPGRVTTTVTDLVVPAPGLPIQISRTYDSLMRSTSSDFGYGWSLGIKVQLEIANTQDVTLTINGQRRTFFFAPTSTILGIYTPGYTPEPGLFVTLQNPSSNCGSGISNQLVKTGNVASISSSDTNGTSVDIPTTT